MALPSPLQCTLRTALFAAIMAFAPPLAAKSAPALTLQEAAPPAPSADALWWRDVGDPVLQTLVDRGLGTDRGLGCEAIALNKARTRDQSRARRIDRRIISIFSDNGASAEGAERMAEAYDYADHRANLAARIALAYVEVRRLQEIRTLRRKLQAQFADNAEIARFRREAGLVDGLDVGLAGSLVAVNGSDLDADQQRLRESMDELARLSGTSLDALTAAMGEEGKVPPLDGAATSGTALAADAMTRADLLALERRLAAILMRADTRPADLAAALAQPAPTTIDPPQVRAAETPLPQRSVLRYRAAILQARQELGRESEALGTLEERIATIARRSRDARGTASSARVAYRNGAVPYATVYAAEAAAGSLSEADIRARADLASSRVRLLRAQGKGWSVADLDPPAFSAGAGEVLVCD